jgi:hypothetical protein
MDKNGMKFPPPAKPGPLSQRSRRALWALAVLLVATALLSACGRPPDPADLPDSAISPTPTMDPSGFQAVETQACLVRHWSTIQGERRQAGTTIWMRGSLLAWQPARAGEDAPPALAYLAPNERTSWFTGVVTLVTAPDFNKPIALAPNTLAVGDLTWSPDGSRLAFLALRADDGLYTVYTVRADGTGLTDLFPDDLAQTDVRTSRKAIIGWRNNSTLQVMVSCGEACRQSYDMNVSASIVSLPSPTQAAHHGDLDKHLEMYRNTLPFQEDDYPRGMRDPNWSPDQQRFTFIDRRGLLWLGDMEGQTHALLDIGLRDVTETQWSPHSDFISVRAEDRVFLFRTVCD